jgi:hypothetical protein
MPAPGLYMPKDSQADNSREWRGNVERFAVVR